MASAIAVAAALLVIAAGSLVSSIISALMWRSEEEWPPRSVIDISEEIPF